jgi:predicted PurR-regulated permease PerM
MSTPSSEEPREAGASPRPPQPEAPDDRRADLVFAGAVGAALVLIAMVLWGFPMLGAIVLLSGLLTYALLPVVDWVGRHMPRAVAILLVAVGGVGLGVLGLWLAAPLVVDELSEVPRTVQATASHASEKALSLKDRLPGELGAWLDKAARSARDGLLEDGAGTSTLSAWASSAARGLKHLMTALLFVPVFVFVMLRSYHPIMQAARRVVPPRWRSRFMARAKEADLVLSGFVRGQLLVALIMGVLYGIAFTLIGLPLGLPLGVIAGVGEIVPFLGGAVVLVLGSLLALASGSPTQVLWVLGIFVVLQSLESALISPWIVGKKARLGPGLVVLAVAVGGNLFGLTGLLLAVPAAALARVAVRAALHAYRESPFFHRPRSA